MRLAVSNVAWDAGEDDTVLAIMKRARVRRAGGRTDEDLGQSCGRHGTDGDRLSATLGGAPNRIVAMQSLLFGQQGLELFNGPPGTHTDVRIPGVIVRLAWWLGARALVFGSPQSRVLHGWILYRHAKWRWNFFAGWPMWQRGTEPRYASRRILPFYGSEFAQTTAEAIEVVDRWTGPASAFSSTPAVCL